MRARYRGRMMGSLFFDPLASAPSIPERLRGSGASPTGAQRSVGATGERPPRRTGQAADAKTLRAASLRKVSQDLERLLRQQGR